MHSPIMGGWRRHAMCPSFGDKVSRDSIVYHRTVKAHIRYHLYGEAAGVESSYFRPTECGERETTVWKLAHIAIIDEDTRLGRGWRSGRPPLAAIRRVHFIR
jgi:hypothetical protein